MAKYKVEISGINTNDITVLSQEEMNELFKKMHQGDPFAREILVQGNLKLVLSILKKFVNKAENLDDLFQIGCIGLLKAIDNFDLSHEVKFSTYAVPMILGEVKRYIRDNTSCIRVSRSTKDLAYKVLKLKEEYLQNIGEEKSNEAIAKELEVPIYDVINALESLKEPISMFEPIYNDGGDTIYLYDQIEDKTNSSSEISTKLAIATAIENLSSREKYILDERFITGKTQMEIAEELNISQAQVSRLEKGAIKQLKKVLK
ncbi:MAG: SigB/SigF/SigG family RNA polymerase sigma factor [Bacilli bacterium]|nr:SigB/SigF/SigG family RNA polymerase sigma factor [Bacilli bacterium]